MQEEKEKKPAICRRCHRRLKNQIAIERGLGDICYKKVEEEKKNIQKRLF